MALPEHFGPLLWSMRLKPCDDAEITCVVCWKNRVSHEITVRLDGRVITFGVHVDCANAAGLTKPTT